MRSVSAILIFMLLSVAGSSHAQQSPPPQISVTTDRDILTAGEPFQLTVTIETQSQREPNIRLPQLGGFRVLSQSESHPMSFSFSFGTGRGAFSQSRRQSIYSFVLLADKAGKYAIEPVIVEIDGRSFRSESSTLTVRDAGGSMGVQLAPQPSQPSVVPGDDLQGGAQPLSGVELKKEDLDGARVDKDFFIQTSVSKKNVVVGEMVLVSIYLYTAWNISDLEMIREPGTEGFWVENLLPGNRNLTSEPVVVLGRKYNRTLLKKLALFPIKPGTLTIAPTMVEIEISPAGFFSNRRTAKRAAIPVQLEVAQLPPDGQPPGFDPANVGRYSFNATIDTNKVSVGEPVTLTLTAQGEGNVRGLALPKLDEVEGFKLYAPENDAEVSATGDSVTGVNTSKILMIPKEPGERTVPALSWSYFDPVGGRYEVVQAKEQKITVLPSAGASEPRRDEAQVKTEKAGVRERLDRQLLSILSRAEIKVAGNKKMLTRPWFLLLAALAPLLYIGLAVGSGARLKMEENRIKGRSKRAKTVALQRLAKLSKRSEEISHEAFFGELQRCLIGFIEDRLETAVAGDTIDELKARLVARGFGQGDAEQVATEVESFDFARFSRSAGGDAERRASLEKIRRLVKSLADVKVLPEPEAGA